MFADAFLDGVARWLTTYVVHSSILLVGALLLDRLLSDRFLRLRDTALRAAFVGGIVTASLQGPLALGTDLLPAIVASPVAVASVSAAEAPDAASAVVAEAEAGPEEREFVGDPTPSATAAIASPVPQATAAASWRRPALAALLLAWGSGAAFLLVRRVRARRLLRRALAGRVPCADARSREDLAAAVAAAGLRRPVRLTTVDGLSSPVAFGVLRPEICVPTRALAELAPARRRAMLAHEVAHHARRDPAWSAATGVLSAALFLQPLHRAASRRLRAASEILCDVWAAERCGGGLPLAACLAEVAGWAADRDAASLVPAMARPGPLLTRRIERLLAPEAPLPVDRLASRWSRALLPAAALGVVLALAPGCGAQRVARCAPPCPPTPPGPASFVPRPSPLGADLAALDLEIDALADAVARARLGPEAHDALARVQARRRALAERADALGRLLPPAPPPHSPPPPSAPPIVESPR